MTTTTLGRTWGGVTVAAAIGAIGAIGSMAAGCGSRRDRGTANSDTGLTGAEGGERDDRPMAPSSTAAPDCSPGTPAPVAGALCQGDRWCWYNPLPAGHDLSAVWRAPDGTLWTAPNAPGLLQRRHADGAWTFDNVPAQTVVRAFWADSASSLWAVGSGKGSAALHWDGEAWSEVPLPAGVEQLTDIDGTGPNDIWVVGNFNDLLHFDGGAWTRVDVRPAATFIPSDVPPVVAAAAPDDVWIGAGQLLVHWDGLAWTREPLIGNIDDVWVAAPGVVYRIRRYYPINGFALTLDRRQGDAWTEVLQLGEFPGWENPQPGRLSGTGPDDVWVVDPIGRAHHFDGMSWTAVSTGSPLKLGGLWAETAGRAVVVGAAGEIREWVGNTFGRITRGPQRNTSAISGSSERDVWFTGPTTAVGPGGLFKWNGIAVEEVPLPPDMPQTPWGNFGALSIWVPNPGTVWIGGLAGLLARRNGADEWRRFDVTTDEVGRIWGANPDEAWSVAGGKLFRWAGGEWGQEEVPVTYVNDVHGTAADDVWIAGGDGVAHWDGYSWTIVPGISSAIKVFARTHDDVWATSYVDHMTLGVFHFGGTAFREVKNVYRASSVSIWSPGPGELFIAGSSDAHILDPDNPEWGFTGVLRLAGDSLTGSLLDVPISQLWGSAAGNLWAAGASSAILRRAQ